MRINAAVKTHQASAVSSPKDSLKAADASITAQPTGDEFKVAPWKPVKLRDASARAALGRLEKTAGAEVSAAELNRALKAGTADKDAQFTNKEFKDFSAWALRNAGRLTDGAKQVMALYTKAAGAAGGKPLSPEKYSKLMAQLGAVKEAPSTTPPEPKPKSKSVNDHPGSWFISQVKSRKFNSREDDGSGNCGPTSLTMIAKAFGKVHGGPGQMDAAIEHTRRDKMHAGTNENYGTAISQIKNGAKAYGLETHSQVGHGETVKRRLDDTIDHIKANLGKGRPVIVHGVMIRSEHDSRSSKYGEGGHYFVVTGIEKNKAGKWVAHLNDPNWPDGPRTVPLSRLRESIRRRGTFATLAVWDKK